MYAVIQTGGKQYRVREGDVLRVARLASGTGKKVSFDQVLLLGEGDAVKTGAEAAGARVSAEVVEEGLGRKIVIFRKRRRKHSKRTLGHRQAYTAVRITKIAAARKAKAGPAEAKAAAAKKPRTASAAAKKRVATKEVEKE